MILLSSAAAAAFGGCTAPDASFERPERRHILSSIGWGAEGEILVAATFSGGAAGDVTLRLLACPSDGARCEQLAAIDRPNSRPVPEVASARGAVVLTVNRSDRIGFFRSFSRVIPSLSEGPIYLRYRD